MKSVFSFGRKVLNIQAPENFSFRLLLPLANRLRARVRTLGALTKDPLAHVGRASRQFNALLFAANQEINCRHVHQGDLAQFQDFARAAAVHCRSNAGDAIRLNATAEQQPSDASVGLFFPALVHDLLVAGAAKGAAFPSSHVAVAVVIWLLAWRLTRPVFWLLAAIVPALALVTVYGGFHYAVDSAAGALVGVAGFLGGPYVHRFLGGDSLESATRPSAVSREPRPG